MAAKNRQYPARPRDASSVVVLRGSRDNPDVLLGWRPVSEAFDNLELRGVAKMALCEAAAVWRDRPSPDPARRVKRLTNRRNPRLMAFE